MRSMNPPKLVPNSLDLPSTGFGSKVGLLSELGRSNEPIAVMLTCWELGGVPGQLAHANPGEILVVQNPGGMGAGRRAAEAS